MFDMYPLPAAPVHEFAVADPCPAAGVKVYKVVFFLLQWNCIRKNMYGIRKEIILL